MPRLCRACGPKGPTRHHRLRPGFSRTVFRAVDLEQRTGLRTASWPCLADRVDPAWLKQASAPAAVVPLDTLRHGAMGRWRRQSPCWRSILPFASRHRVEERPMRTTTSAATTAWTSPPFGTLIGLLRCRRRTHPDYGTVLGMTAAADDRQGAFFGGHAVRNHWAQFQLASMRSPDDRLSDCPAHAGNPVLPRVEFSSAWCPDEELLPTSLRARPVTSCRTSGRFSKDWPAAPTCGRIC